MSSDLKSYWGLDPQLCFLNHGSFGATPTAILLAQQELRARLERDPVHFLGHDLEGLLDDAREQLAQFIGAQSTELALISNATLGVNTILRSLHFQPDDEILITDQTYNACRNAVEVVAQQTGAQVVVAALPFPLTDSQQVVDAVLAKVSARTRLALLDHVTSPTALILPMATLVKELNDRDIDTLVDGAHAPGLVDLNIQELGAAYYTGNCHKWLCAPKGAAFLWVRADKQALIRPLVISHGANSPRLDRSLFHREFDWVGTHDPTAYLCIPQAIAFMQALLPGGWPAVRHHNRQLALEARQLLCQALAIDLPAPASMIGSMAAVPLPTLPCAGELFQRQLWQEFKIQVPLMPWPTTDRWLLRISAQLYNDLSQYQHLAEALQLLLM